MTITATMAGAISSPLGFWHVLRLARKPPQFHRQDPARSTQPMAAIGDQEWRSSRSRQSQADPPRRPKCARQSGLARRILAESPGRRRKSHSRRRRRSLPRRTRVHHQSLRPRRGDLDILFSNPPRHRQPLSPHAALMEQARAMGVGSQAHGAQALGGGLPRPGPGGPSPVEQRDRRPGYLGPMAESTAGLGREPGVPRCEGQQAVPGLAGASTATIDDVHRRWRGPGN